jgi:hypothetical protein
MSVVAYVNDSTAKTSIREVGVAVLHSDVTVLQPWLC